MDPILRLCIKCPATTSYVLPDLSGCIADCSTIIGYSWTVDIDNLTCIDCTANHTSTDFRSCKLNCPTDELHTYNDNVNKRCVFCNVTL